MNAIPNNKLYGYIKYEKGREHPHFKITDTLTKGEKCNTKTTNEIKKNLNKLNDKLLKTKKIQFNKLILCNDVELLMKRNDNIKLNGKKWYYTPEEYEIYFGNII